jgi:hypothetical protein
MSLQHRAVTLLGSHPASHICRALKINDTALKRWAGNSSTVSGCKPMDEAFVALLIISHYVHLLIEQNINFIPING